MVFLIIFAIATLASVLMIYGIAWISKEVREFDSWRIKGEEMAKVPTPPEHLNPRRHPSTITPIARLRDCDDSDTFWELSYLVRSDSEAPFSYESVNYLSLDSAKDKAIELKGNKSFYKNIRIQQRLKGHEFGDGR